jgi:hypothetical protein
MERTLKGNATTGYYWGEKEPEPGFRCTCRDCDQAFWEVEDMKKCEGCGQRFCDDHLEPIDEFFFCDDCARCERNHMVGGEVRKCGDPAKFCCARCGDLLCPGDTRTFNSYDPETGYGESGYVCRGGCSGFALDPAEVGALMVEGA